MLLTLTIDHRGRGRWLWQLFDRRGLLLDEGVKLTRWGARRAAMRSIERYQVAIHVTD